MTTLVTYERESSQGYATYTLHNDSCPVIVRALKGRDIDSIDLDLLVIERLTATLEYEHVCGRCKPNTFEADRVIVKGVEEYEAKRKADEGLAKKAESERLRQVKGLAPQLRIEWPGAVLSSYAPGKYRAQLAHNFAVQFAVIETRTFITMISHDLVLRTAEDFRRAYRPLQLIEQFVAIDPEEI